MSVTLSVTNFCTSSLCTDEHPINIRLMSVTRSVVNLLMSIFVGLLQYANAPCMEVTALVLRYWRFWICLSVLADSSIEVVLANQYAIDLGHASAKVGSITTVVITSATTAFHNGTPSCGELSTALPLHTAVTGLPLKSSPSLMSSSVNRKVRVLLSSVHTAYAFCAEMA